VPGRWRPPRLQGRAAGAPPTARCLWRSGGIRTAVGGPGRARAPAGRGRPGGPGGRFASPTSDRAVQAVRAERAGRSTPASRWLPKNRMLLEVKGAAIAADPDATRRLQAVARTRLTCRPPSSPSRVSTAFRTGRSSRPRSSAAGPPARHIPRQSPGPAGRVPAGAGRGVRPDRRAAHPEHHPRGPALGRACPPLTSGLLDHARGGRGGPDRRRRARVSQNAGRRRATLRVLGLEPGDDLPAGRVCRVG
jgi:hypothetical protein